MSTYIPLRPVPPKEANPSSVVTSAAPVVVNGFKVPPFVLKSRKSHILPSVCQSPLQCSVPKKETVEGGNGSVSSSQDLPLCNACRFTAELNLPQLPDMIFPENVLMLEHVSSGIRLSFTALEALKRVNASQDLMKVAVAEAWKETSGSASEQSEQKEKSGVSETVNQTTGEGAKKVSSTDLLRASSKQRGPGKGSDFIESIIKPFDWTYTTDYEGTLILPDSYRELAFEPTSERIDVERLKSRDKILWFCEMVLFEDELADNGCALLSIKARVMPTFIFILLRFYLRVDGVVVRTIDTRFFIDTTSQTPVILREHSHREAEYKDLNFPVSVICDQNQIWQYLPIVKEEVHRLVLPTAEDSDPSLQTKICGCCGPCSCC
ncbi:unnamed protein product [Cyprideis torosa]|uniref:TIP41-like protein n=1 Tax=Cyprideis torosa TaxID=163714 RepID=A0A7R8W460_9CRUS|nr:unnamed protein product [Cyprideis torosa]CAG0883802.1 unnamed protein product [Cyprideis torosa]